MFDTKYSVSYWERKDPILGSHEEYLFICSNRGEFTCTFCGSWFLKSFNYK